MRWYALVSLMSDSRIKFLLWFAVVAVTIAIILTLIEIRLKRRRKKYEVKTVDELGIEKMQRFLKQDKTPREKLDFVDRTAKEYFKETYRTALNSSYSSLVEELEKYKAMRKKMSSEKESTEEVLLSPKNEEITFCKMMFATYYSNKELTNSQVVLLGKMLINIKRGKRKEEEAPRVSFFSGGLEKVFRGMEEFFSKIIEEYLRRSYDRKLRRKKTAKMKFEKNLVEEKVKAMQQKQILINRARKAEKVKRKIKKFNFGWIKDLLGVGQVKKKERVLAVKKERAPRVQAQKIEVVEDKGNKKLKENVLRWEDKIIDDFRKIFPRKKLKRIEHENFYKNIISETSGDARVGSVFEMKKEGIAERIVKNEKNRLEQTNVFLS